MKTKFGRILATLVGVGLLSYSTLPLNSATGTLTISGTVTSAADVTIAPTALATALTLVEGVVNQKVATINERSNNLLGYTVSLSSANAVAASSSIATLVRTGGGGETPIYTLTYGGLPVVFVAGVALVTPVGLMTDADGIDKDLNLTMVPGQVFTAGTYTDTLTITLTNN